MSFFNMIGEVPIKNWAGVPSVDMADVTPLDGQMVNTLQEKKFGCWRCPIACGGHMKAGTGQYKYPAGVHRPEYETLVTFGNLCLNDNLESTIMAADICNRYGLDSISAGVSIAFAIECYENGLITDKDTDGIQLKWGNHEAIIAMTEKVAKREGFGDILADGIKVAAEKIGKGADKFAIHIHGQELPMHDPKPVRAVDYAPTFLLDATPSRHTQWSVPQSGLELPPFDPMTFAGRGEAIKMARNLQHVMQCAGLCMFGYTVLDANSLPEFLNLVTGWNHSIDDLLTIGERVANIRQAFNVREGITLSDFKMPNRVLGRPPFEAGPTAGREVDMETMARDYLVAMDWDPDTAKPSKKKLLELGLEDVAKALWPE
jgi:aldehyde:ferredoxin oxidoreductase